MSLPARACLRYYLEFALSATLFLVGSRAIGLAFIKIQQVDVDAPLQSSRTTKFLCVFIQCVCSFSARPPIPAFITPIFTPRLYSAQYANLSEVHGSDD